MEPDEFTWVSGEGLLTTYESKDGEGLQFCQICGSTLCGTFKGQIQGVTLGCTDGDPGIRLGMHIFVGEKASWETLPDDGIPQYEESPPANSSENS